MGIEFFMMADKLAKLKDARDKSQDETMPDNDMAPLNPSAHAYLDSLSHTDKTALEERIKDAMLDEWPKPIEWAKMWRPHELSNPNPALSYSDKP